MYYAACFFAAMFIVEPILLPASISTSASGNISANGSTLATCSDTGTTSAGCSLVFTPPPPNTFDRGGRADAQIAGDWNTAFAEYLVYRDQSAASNPRASTNVTWTVDDVVTIHGGSGPAFLVMYFDATQGMVRNGLNSRLFVNRDSVPVQDGVTPTPPHGFVVPFTFDVAFPLRFGLIADAFTSGDTTFDFPKVALRPAQVYMSYGGTVATDPIFDFVVTRESGASFGTPEPSAFTMFACGLGVLGVGSLIGHLRRGARTVRR
jgi:hypothetical protein